MTPGVEPAGMDGDRRRLLAASGAAFVALAGCSEGERDGRDDGADTATDAEGDPATPEAATQTPGDSARPPAHEGYETATVRAVSAADGVTLGSVTAAIADTDELRYLGLSDTESLPEDRGMLFVYGSVADRAFVMREMDFGIDIVYADDAGTITEIHHAPAPGPEEDGNAMRYPGRGQYVLEVAYEWTTRHGVDVGDRLAFELP